LRKGSPSTYAVLRVQRGRTVNLPTTPLPSHGRGSRFYPCIAHHFFNGLALASQPAGICGHTLVTRSGQWRHYASTEASGKFRFGVKDSLRFQRPSWLRMTPVAGRVSKSGQRTGGKSFDRLIASALKNFCHRFWIDMSKRSAPRSGLPLTHFISAPSWRQWATSRCRSFRHLIWQHFAMFASATRPSESVKARFAQRFLLPSN
jgi:hypothetical protein